MTHHQCDLYNPNFKKIFPSGIEPTTKTLLQRDWSTGLLSNVAVCA